MLSNFIPINRKLFKHEFWLEKRPYSKFEAWLDILTTARFDHTEGRMLVGSAVVRWNRGEMVASIRFLMERWRWTKNKVESFLKLLKAEKMIKTRTAERTTQTIITICNYDTYNAIKQITGQQTGQQPDTGQTVTGQEPDKTNTDNKEQESKQKTIYRGFAHLILFTDEFLKLTDAGYTPTQINQVLTAIENYRGNKKYKSLYLTAKTWLGKQPLAAAQNPSKPGRIINIASAFQQALQHG